MTWMAPRTVAEAVRLKAEWPEATLVAGGTFVGILTRQGLLASDAWISLQDVRELRELSTGSELALGAMVTHRRIELDPGVAAGWPGVRQVFAAVASPRSATPPPSGACWATPTTPRTLRPCSSRSMPGSRR